MKYIVDMVERDVVVLEDLEGKRIEISRGEISFEIADGDVLKKEKDKFVLDKEETKKRRESISSRFSKLKKKKS